MTDQNNAPERLTDDAIRSYAKEHGIYVRENASYPDIRNGGWIHPFTLTISNKELRAMFADIARADRAAPEEQGYFGPMGIPHWSSAITPPPAAQEPMARIHEHLMKNDHHYSPACQQEAVTVAEAAQVILNTQIHPSSVDWQYVWDAMREDAKEGDLPMAFNKALRALKGGS